MTHYLRCPTCGEFVDDCICESPDDPWIEPEEDLGKDEQPAAEDFPCCDHSPIIIQ